MMDLALQLIGVVVALVLLAFAAVIFLPFVRRYKERKGPSPRKGGGKGEEGP